MDARSPRKLRTRSLQVCDLLDPRSLSKGRAATEVSEKTRAAKEEAVVVAVVGVAAEVEVVEAVVAAVVANADRLYQIEVAATAIAKNMDNLF